MENNTLTLLSTPGIWYPGQLPEEFDNEVELMLQRSLASRDLINGQLDAETFLDFLDAQGLDIHLMLDDIEECLYQ